MASQALTGAAAGKAATAGRLYTPKGAAALPLGVLSPSGTYQHVSGPVAYVGKAAAAITGPW